MKNTILLGLLILSILSISCKPDENISGAKDITPEKLLAAPLSININNQEIFLQTVLWRDFMPPVPANGKFLNGIANIETKDMSTIPSAIKADMVYFVYRGEVWDSYFTDETSGTDPKPYRISKIVRDGPKWDTGIYVDVIVRIMVGSHEYLLRAEKQCINRVE